MKSNIVYSLVVWLIFSQVIWRFVYMVAYISISFLLSVEPCSNVGITRVCLSIYFLMDIWVASEFWPLQMKLLWMFT